MHSSGGLKAEWKTRPTGKACTIFFFLIYRSAWYLQSVIRLSKYIAMIDICVEKKENAFKLHYLQSTRRQLDCTDYSSKQN